MSELVDTSADRASLRWQLLSTVSVLALLASVYTAAGAVKADDNSDRPTLWIELGGQLSRLDDGQEVFAPVFPNSPSRPSIFEPSQKFERLPLYSIDETGKFSFEPIGSDWVFSASIRYGRSASNKHVHQQTYPKPVFIHYYTADVVGRHQRTHGKYPNAEKSADTSTQNGESHSIIDFQAGKDVGLGMFGDRNGSFVLNFGVRFAQFSNKSNIALKSDPNWHFHYRYFPSLVGRTSGFGLRSSKVPVSSIYHNNAASLRAMRSFHGIGPSLSWNASAPVAGDSQGGELTLDWGINAALLFGRQRVHTHHQTTGRYHPRKYPGYDYQRPITFQGPATPDHTRNRTVTVPDVGGFAGITLHRSIAKISLGYRADFFFGTMDGGIDRARKENVGFYGPFASVSVGIGG